MSVEHVGMLSLALLRHPPGDARVAEFFDAVEKVNALAARHLTYPMLDNLTGSDAQPGDPLFGEFVWTREHNRFGWACYLGDGPADAPQVPARVKDFAGLPPAWIHTVSLDLFRDENIAYAQGLLAAGVPTELAVWPGGCRIIQPP